MVVVNTTLTSTGSTSVKPSSVVKTHIITTTESKLLVTVYTIESTIETGVSTSTIPTAAGFIPVQSSLPGSGGSLVKKRRNVKGELRPHLKSA